MKNKLPILVIVSFFVFGFCASASAADLYVSVSGSGSACTSQDPCALSYAIDNASAGSFVYLDAGDYGDVIFDSGSSYGSFDNWISYSAWPGRESPRIESMILPSSETDVFLKFYDLVFDPGYLESTKNTVNMNEADHVIFDSCYFEGAKVLGASGDFAPYCFQNSAIIATHYLNSPSHVTISNSTFKYGYNGIAIFSNEGRDWDLVGNTLHEVGDNSIQIAASPSDILISENEIYHGTQHRSVRYWPGSAGGDWSGHQFETVTQDNTGASGIFYYIDEGAGRFYMFADDENNIPIRTSTDIWRLDSNPAQIYWVPSGRGDDAHTDLISIEGASRDIIIEKNLLHQSTAQAIKIGISGGTASNVSIRNNIIYSYQPGTYLLYFETGTNIQVYNNVVDSGDQSPYKYRALRMLARYSPLPEIEFRNNIISGGVYEEGGIVMATNNIWNLTESELVDAYEGGNSFYGQDFDNLFVDRTNHDYRLLADSLAVDAGFDIGSLVTTDHEGTIRPQDGDDSGTAEYDIGAYEFKGENPIAVIRGDVNQDYQVNINDALLTLRNSTGLDMSVTAWVVSNTTGDVNCDGVSNTIDAMLLLRNSLGLGTSGSGWCE